MFKFKKTNSSKLIKMGFMTILTPMLFFNSKYGFGYLQPYEIAGQQITRKNSSAVNGRIMDRVFKAATFNKGNKGAASADSRSYKPDIVWGEVNISQITEESGNVNIADFDSDIYQFIGGLDNNYNDLFYGMALTYAYAEHEVASNNDSTMHTVGVTPYVAYKFTDYLFASGLASYYYSHTNNINNIADIDIHDYEIEGNINAFKVIHSVILKGRAGVRYKHVNTSIINAPIGGDNTFDELIWIGDAEIGYRFDNGLSIFTGALYEHYDREASETSVRTRDNIFLMRYGVDYAVSKDFSLGAKIENDLNDEDRDYFTGTVHFRLEL